MFNYLLKIEYDGTKFVGWQSQKNGRSIQSAIEKALKRVLKTQIRITGSGRTINHRSFVGYRCVSSETQLRDG